MRRTRFEAAMEKRRAMREAEAAGSVADSHAIRLAIMQRVRSGEITLDQAQAELRNIQSAARTQGMQTRAQAFSNG